MGELQAMSAGKPTRRRPLSAQIHSDALLSEAIRLPFEDKGGADTEALEGAVQLAENGASALQGWATDAPPSIEEQR